MGRSTKKVVALYCALLIAWMPLSVVAATVDCLFHENTTPAIESSTSSSHISAFDLSDVDLSDIGVSHEEESAYSPENGCSGQLIVVAINDIQVFADVNWAKSDLHVGEISQLSTVLLPRDIRPPISA